MKHATTQAARDSLSERIVIDTLGDLGDPNCTDLDAGGGEGPDFSLKLIHNTKAAGVTALNLTIGYALGNADPFAVTQRAVAQWNAIIDTYQNDLIHVKGACDILRAKREGKLGLIYGFQSAEMLGQSTARVDEFADAGVRIMQLTYNGPCAVGSGALVDDRLGLTPFGRDVVARINAKRAVVDLSHSNRQTCLDAIDCSTQPVAITHTGCQALVDVPRNKTDHELRLVAESGGYIGIYCMPFLANARNATGDDVIVHIEHAIQVCGENHVGIGIGIGIGIDTSYTPIEDQDAYRLAFTKIIETRRALGISAPGKRPDVFPFLADMNGVQQIRELAARLEQRGHGEARIDKILGVNFLRYAQTVWGD